MKLEANLVEALLQEQFEVEKYGADLKDTPLGMPVFYAASMTPEEGGIYLTRARELPKQCGAKCLFLCVGERPECQKIQWQCEVLWVRGKSIDMIAVANFVLHTFQTLTDWLEEMERLVRQDTPVEGLVERSIPIFENCITITDYNLRVLASCKEIHREHGRQIVIDHSYEHLPSEVTTSLTDSFLQNVNQRAPFFFKGQKENPDGMNYCINLYLGDCYMGSCALWEKGKSFRQSDLLLFAKFASFIGRALRNRTQNNGQSILTVKSVFSDLLECFPVSESDVDTVLEWVQQNLNLCGYTFGRWYCIVIRSANDGKTLPAEYLCATLEDLLPYAYAFSRQDHLAAFCMLPDELVFEDAVSSVLHPYLRDMNFRAGISDGFSDVYDARAYYLQAMAALKTGRSLSPVQYLYRFRDYVLFYMLEHCQGSFEPGQIFSEGLQELLELDGGVDYIQTLRLYLENECNAAKTAQQLHLHRSSLLPRLEKIREHVEMETPEERLYLRICLKLLEIQS